MRLLYAKGVPAQLTAGIACAEFSSMMTYYLLYPTGVIEGPHDATEMVRLLESGTIGETIKVAAAGDSGWHPLSELLSVILFEARECTRASTVPQSKEDIVKRCKEVTSPILLPLLDEERPSLPEQQRIPAHNQHGEPQQGDRP